MQRLLRTAGWDVDGVRDDLRGYVIEHLGDAASAADVPTSRTGPARWSRR